MSRDTLDTSSTSAWTGWLAKQGDKVLRPDQIIRNEGEIQIAEDRKVMATFSNVDFQRTRFWCLCASVSIDFPRRLGADADRYDLKRDKTISRKVCAAYHTLWKMYHRETDAPAPPDWADRPIQHIDPLMNRIGATVIWDRQVDYLAEVAIRRSQALDEFEYIARMDGMASWYNKHSEMLNWELQAMYRIMEFMQAKRPAA